MKTGRLRSNMPGLHLVGKGRNGDVLNPFGPVKVGLTTSRTIQNQQLTELLSSLEREVVTIESRFSEVCATLAIVTARLAELGLIGIKPSLPTIDKEEEGE